MKRSSATTPDPQLVSCKTTVESTQSVMSWEIEKFSLLCPREGGDEDDTLNIFSPLQETILRNCGENGKSDLRLNWQIQLCTNGSESANKDFLSIYFYIHKNGTTPTESIPEMRMIFKASVIGGATNSSVVSCTATFVSSALTDAYGNRFTDGYGEGKFIKLEDVWKDGSEYLSSGDSLHLKIAITFSAHSPTNATRKWKPALLSQLKNDVLEDLEHLLKSGNNSDLAVKCSGNVFKVHSYVLKARSPVFRAVFEAGMKESIDSEIQIDDVDPPHFEAFLEYLYIGTLPAPPFANLDSLIGLVRVADKYQLLKLRDFCFVELAEHISLERAGEIVVLLSLHSAPEQLRSQCVGFCFKNWSVLSNDATFKEMLTANPTAFLNVRSPLELNTMPNSLEEHSAKAAAAATVPSEN